jgi:hypothetical protein
VADFGPPATVGDFVGSLNQNWYHPVAELGRPTGRKTHVFPLPSDIDNYRENCWATNGIQEVACSIHVSSTNENVEKLGHFFWFVKCFGRLRLC